MPLPGQTFQLVDPGVGSVGKLTNIPLVMGIASSGTTATLETYTSKAKLIADHGQGPSIEMGCALLDVVPMIRYCRVAQAAAGTLGTITRVGTGPTITDNASTPFDRYELKIEITTGGALGTARYRYSLDGGRNYSPILVLPVGGAVTIANTGIALTAPVGTYVAGDTYSATTTAPTFTSTQLDLCKTAIDATPLSWDWLALAGKYADAASANTIAGVIAGYLTDWFSKFKFVRAAMDAGAGSAASTLTGFTTEHRFLMACFGDADFLTSKSMVGWVQPLMPAAVVIAKRAAGALLSTHLGRVDDGPIVGIAAYDQTFGAGLTPDEGLAPGMDDGRFATLRTFRGDAPNRYFVTAGRTRAPITSDFKDWHIAGVACKTMQIIFEQQLSAVNRTWRTNADGTVDEGEASAFEQKVQSALEEALLKPTNAEGTPGHVSAVRYQIDRTNNLNTTKTLVTRWAVRSRASSEFIETSGGFALAVK